MNKIVGSEEFLGYMHTEASPSNFTVRDSLLIKPIAFSMDHDIGFKDCVFTEDVVIDGYETGQSFSFMDCVFRKQIKIVNCKFEHITEVSIFRFTGCNNLELSLDNCLISGVEIKKCESSSISVENCQLTERGIVLTQGTSTGFFFSNSKFNLTFASHSLDGNIITDEVFFPKLLIKETVLNQSLNLTEAKITECIFSNSKFNQSPNIQIKTGMKLISMESCIFQTPFQIYAVVSKDMSLILRDCIFEKTFKLHGSKYEIGRCEIHNCIGELRLLYGTIRYITLRNLATVLNIELITLKVKILHVEKSRAAISINNIVPYGDESSLQFSGCDLSNSIFQNTDLSKFKNIFFESSKLTEITTTNVKWFSPPNLLSATGNFPELHPFSRETYRQLKHNQEKQGNRVQALEFHALEMEYYRLELKNQHKTSRVLAERSILWLGRSNDHGQNWIKPVLLAAFFGYLFYAIMIFEAIGKWNCDVLWNHFPSYFSLMNPIHDLSKVFPDKIAYNGSLQLTDYVWRIILAYLIFQTVSAFRKFIR